MHLPGYIQNRRVDSVVLHHLLPLDLNVMFNGLCFTEVVVVVVVAVAS